ncbi:kinase-like protein [Dacryopinax primogenitus]|uniref:Kinase-like protein n=1 Tax=Dacryopinax primogenitus (strain DJM 731) TaxID=1858805 RepID=M5G172_DACPD|nr:kinase-like protein [Dacryopinax primogenitus]EJU01925.1 kinase-like protein [Dacryopinax primogenitus]
MAVLTDDSTTYDNVRTLAAAKFDRVQPQVQLLMDKACQELHSSDAQLSPIQREAVVRDLRTILTSDTVPDSVRLPGELTIDYSTAIVNHGSDIYKGEWRTIVRGEPRRKVVAVKRLRDPNPSAVRVRRFLYEGTLWRMLAHDNVVPFYGIHAEGKVIELVTLWVENRDAMTYIRNVPGCHRRAIIKGAAYGISYLHRCNIVHGGICGSNILIDDSGRPMMCDFGLATASNADGDLINAGASTSQTTTTARWIAPELTSFNSPVPVPASDVFSFARTILEILTGEKPFPKEKNTFKLIADLRDGRLQVARPDAPEVVLRGLTDGVWALMNEMWKQDLRQRPMMKDVEARLEQLM